MKGGKRLIKALVSKLLKTNVKVEMSIASHFPPVPVFYILV